MLASPAQATGGHPAETLRSIPVAARPFALLREDIGQTAWDRLDAAAELGRDTLAGRTVWSVNSTAVGGGVAEMTRTLWPYWRGAGIDARWLVLEGPPAYFRLTKRIHNLLHGVEARPPGLGDRELYDRVARSVGAHAVEIISAGDVVILQDPQTAGLVEPLKRAGATVIWRCHVGTDTSSPASEAAWSFLAPYVTEADAFVFTRRAFVPPALADERLRVLVPAIDPRSPKNQALAPHVAASILVRSGLAEVPPRTPLEDPRVPVDSHVVAVRRRCGIMRSGPPLRLGRDRPVVALARWDRLKDPVGIIHGFAEHVARPDARLILAGPAPGAVADDPEAGAVLREARRAWQALSVSQRRRIQLVTIPMADLEENALIVNALQRHAAVIVKKSIEEGFGLGVTEGMWKARPVVATRVGGHQEQIEHGLTGLLVDDAHDLEAFGRAVETMLGDPARALDLASAAREQARARFLADGHFVGWMETIAGL